MNEILLKLDEGVIRLRPNTVYNVKYDDFIIVSQWWWKKGCSSHDFINIKTITVDKLLQYHEH